MRNYLMTINLGRRFTIILAVVFILGIIGSSLILTPTLNQLAEQEVAVQGDLLIGLMNAVRHYTSNQVNPLLRDRLETEAVFISQTVPAYSAREVFEQFRTVQQFETFFYKEATLNPVNPRNAADDFEAGLVARFKDAPDQSEITGFTQQGGQRVFYIARPLSVGSDSCLRCHGDPVDAPASQLATYGDASGYGWELDEIVSAQMVYVPAERVFASARTAFGVVMAIFVTAFAVTVLLLNVLLRREVIAPVHEISELSAGIKSATLQAGDPRLESLGITAQRGDELGKLAKIFAEMQQEVRAREERLKQQVKALRIEIDESRKEKQVAEITETDYFQDLQAKARTLRQQRAAKDDKA